MTREEKLEKILEALSDPSALDSKARAALQDAYPNASEAMRQTAHFHVFTDGIDAALDWLLAVADFANHPEEGKEIDEGATFHLLYHLYNWQQFQALLPVGGQGLVELSGDLKQAVQEQDLDWARNVAEQIEAKIKGGERAPGIIREKE